MNDIAMVVGYLVLVCAGATVLSALLVLLDGWWRQRRATDLLIRHLAYEGELILASERKRRERAA